MGFVRHRFYNYDQFKFEANVLFTCKKIIFYDEYYENEEVRIEKD